jgi:hypothetical protein
VGSKLPLGLKRVAPVANVVTEYDRKHFKQYVALLDALASGVDEDTMCRDILHLDPTTESIQAKETLKSHVERAQWMCRIGFRQI